MEIFEDLLCGFQLVPMTFNSLDLIQAKQIIKPPLHIEVSVFDAQLTLL